MASFIETYRQTCAEQAKRDADPLLAKVAATVRGIQAISSVALLDLLGLRPTTGNGRRVGPLMRQLGFIPIRSRRLEPGGWRTTIARGWMRPLRPNAKDRSRLAASDAHPNGGSL